MCLGENTGTVMIFTSVVPPIQTLECKLFHFRAQAQKGIFLFLFRLFTSIRSFVCIWI